VLFALLVGLGGRHVAPVPLGIHGRWHVIFDDEFTGSALDTNKWSTGWYGSGVTGPVNVRKESQCYAPSQVAVQAGELDLSLIARTETCNTGSGTITRPYLSGIVTTNGKFAYTYGYLEARVWLPGAGTVADWPAIWGVGQNWPTDGELDVVEGIGGKVCWHFHDAVADPGTCVRRRYTGGWHTFGANWERGVVTWYYDGVRIGRARAGITGKPMYLVLDLAASISRPVEAPASLRVRYVRVWQH